jgi:branched-chain amino acid transport system ATP-binding protein
VSGPSAPAQSANPRQADPVPEGRLAATGISVRFGGVQALSGVSITVPPRCITGLVGPNGAGKSTLFAVLSGLLRPQGGRVFLNGTDVTTMRAYRRARAGLSRTFQHPELFSSLTVREHLSIAYRLKRERARLWTDLVTGRALRKPGAPEREVVDGLLDALSLSAIADADVRALPLGTCRLVEVGRALAGQPSVVLLDEPSAGLSPPETRALSAALAQIVETMDVSLLLVEHDLDMVLGLSRQVTVIDFGVRIAVGTPDEIRADPVVQAAYLGTELPAQTEQPDADPPGAAAQLPAAERQVPGPERGRDQDHPGWRLAHG